ncbi:MAG: tetratricopeptide repeat protein [Acidibacillus sp.]|nr:tetratricopeptide repeat protein [Acidibacillus sp.]
MLFHEPFERLMRAVSRIAKQLETADVQQRQYLIQELEELRTLCNPFFEMWLSFEDQIEALYEQYALPPEEGEEYVKPKQVLQGKDSTAHTSESAKPSQEFMVELGSTLLSEQGHQLFRRGLGYFDLLMFPESIVEFKKIIEMDPHMVIARLYLAINYIATEQYEEAHVHLSFVQQVAQDHLLRAAVHDARAQMYMRQNNYEQALDELTSVLSINPSYSDAYFNHAVCAYHTGNFTLAQDSAKKVLTENSMDVDAWRIYGSALFAIGNIQSALAVYAKIRKWVPKNPQIAIELAKIYVSLKRIQEAETLLHEVEKNSQVRSAYYGLQGDIALYKGLSKEAVALFKKQASLTRAPISTQRLAWALYADQRFDEARQYFEQHYEQHKDSISSVVGLARIASYQGNLATARGYLQQLIRDKRSKVRAIGLSELGRMYLEHQDIERAKRFLYSSLAIDRTQETAIALLGLAMRLSANDATYKSSESLSTNSSAISGIDSTASLSDT